MRTKFLSVFVIMAVSTAFVFACSKNVKDDQNKKGHPVKVGYFLKDGSGDAELGLSFVDALSLVQELNKDVKIEYDYAYSDVWIETIVNLDDSKDFYLAARADVTDRDGNEVYSSYTHYISLTVENGSLVLGPVYPTYTCTGYCCKTCTLTPAGAGQTGPSCECDLPSDTPSCSGEARCDQSTTIGGGGSSN